MSVLLMLGFYGFRSAIRDEERLCNGCHDGKPVSHKIVDKSSRMR